MAEVTLEFIARKLEEAREERAAMRDDMAEIKQRLQAVETGLVDLRREIGGQIDLLRIEKAR